MISDEQMRHLANLARLELPDDELESLKGDLNRLLGYFDQIRGLDTDGVEELARPIESENVFREDVVRPGLSPDEARSVAVETKDGFFRVPRTVDTGG